MMLNQFIYCEYNHISYFQCACIKGMTVLLMLLQNIYGIQCFYKKCGNNTVDYEQPLWMNDFYVFFVLL